MDILIVVSNDKLLDIVPEGVPLQEAFSMADEILRQVRLPVTLARTRTITITRSRTPTEA